jgi:hypothetical protein
VGEECLIGETGAVIDVSTRLAGSGECIIGIVVVEDLDKGICNGMALGNAIDVVCGVGGVEICQ